LASEHRNIYQIKSTESGGFLL